MALDTGKMGERGRARGVEGKKERVRDRKGGKEKSRWIEMVRFQSQDGETNSAEWGTAGRWEGWGGHPWVWPVPLGRKIGRAHV